MSAPKSISPDLGCNSGLLPQAQDRTIVIATVADVGDSLEGVPAATTGNEGLELLACGGWSVDDKVATESHAPLHMFALHPTLQPC